MSFVVAHRPFIPLPHFRFRTSRRLAGSADHRGPPRPRAVHFWRGTRRRSRGGNPRAGFAEAGGAV